jgi:hypothetical protein
MWVLHAVSFVRALVYNSQALHHVYVPMVPKSFARNGLGPCLFGQRSQRACLGESLMIAHALCGSAAKSGRRHAAHAATLRGLLARVFV